ncbi:MULTISPECIES: hypothetical protein [Clostridia]|uniref:TRAFAC clade GTPase domain-containing protein n=1 Tax=Clostridia TaxID=186801 RepID=UPI00067F5F84|nr:MULTISPECIES: hypothetical protein [Clostridia]
MSDVSIDEKQHDIDEILNDDIDVESNEQEETDDTEITIENNSYQICSGETLNCKEVYKIAAKENTKVVVFVGPAGSGKTTIETSIYQLFQNTPIGNMYFAGSTTLQGYEQRSFYTRTKSQRDSPATLRTNLESDNPFLHLRVWQSERDMIHNFMFADLSGEVFEAHIGRINDVKKDFYYMDRANYIIGVLDGKRLQNKRKIQSTVSGIIELIRTFCDAGLINEECILQIVFSKYDLLSQITDVEQVISKVKKQIEKRLDGLFINIEYFNIAAMPEVTDSFAVGYGLQDLMYSWIKNRNSKSVRKKVELVELSEFDKLYNKFLGVKE